MTDAPTLAGIPDGHHVAVWCQHCRRNHQPRMSFDESRKADQLARAHRIAYQLAGNRATDGIVRAMLALVEADES
jgi:hypothetical protein